MSSLNLIEIKEKPQKELSDEEILSQSLKNPEAFRLLLERYQGPFLVKAIRMVGIRDLAEDAVQETFIKIYSNADRFKNEEGYNFRSWGYTILNRTCLSQLRKLKREKEIFLHPDPEMEDLFFAEDDKNFLEYSARDYIFSILSRMPVTLSRIIQMYFLDGLSHKEIATVEGMSEGAVRTRLYRAKQEFRKISEITEPTEKE